MCLPDEEVAADVVSVIYMYNYNYQTLLNFNYLKKA